MSGTPFDQLAPNYAEYARRRASYCDAVDRQILMWRGERTTSMLDVGSGDGSRAMRLASALGASCVVLSDPSGPMAEQCRTRGASEVWQRAAEELSVPGERFDAVTCLWNVLGHVDGHARRVEALRRMRALLAPAGRLFMDVHNRYNVATAGPSVVGRRLLRDWIRPDERNGVTEFTWRVGGRQIAASGYLFTPHEVRDLLERAGFAIARAAYIDYATGVPRGRWTGQIVLAATVN